MPIGAVTADSRKVKAGDLFVAIPGTKADGLHFVRDAVARGAAAVMAERAPEQLPDAVAVVNVPNARRALALAAARFYPRQPAHHRRRHRHQRQDLGRGLHPPDLGRARPSGREHRHRRDRLAEAARSTAR